MKINYRQIVGMGWIVCECDKKADEEKKKLAKQKPFVFDPNKL